MLLIYQMNFYKWRFRNGRSDFAVTISAVEWKSNKRSNRCLSKWDLIDTRMANYWPNLINFICQSLSALHHSKYHVLVLAPQRFRYFAREFIHFRRRNERQRWNTMISFFRSFFACFAFAQWLRNSNHQIGLHAQPNSQHTNTHIHTNDTWKCDIHELDRILNHSNYPLFVRFSAVGETEHIFAWIHRAHRAQNLWTILCNGTFHIVYYEMKHFNNVFAFCVDGTSTRVFISTFHFRYAARRRPFIKKHFLVCERDAIRKISMRIRLEIIFIPFTRLPFVPFATTHLTSINFPSIFSWAPSMPCSIHFSSSSWMFRTSATFWCREKVSRNARTCVCEKHEQMPIDFFLARFRHDRTAGCM